MRLGLDSSWIVVSVTGSSGSLTGEVGRCICSGVGSCGIPSKTGISGSDLESWEFMG